MKNYHKIYIVLVLLAFNLKNNSTYSQELNKHTISGNLYLDNSWDKKIYISYIPTFNDMFLMSNNMIIEETKIDSIGNFKFDIDFLPSEKKLYRLHIIKKGDSPASLIIGGKNENHLFFIANKSSNISISTSFSFPPFKNTFFNNSSENKNFHSLRSLIFKADSTASESSSSKRVLIKKKLEKDLLTIVDTSSFSIVSLYAIHSLQNKNLNYSTAFNSYLNNFNNEKNSYFKALKSQSSNKATNSFNFWYTLPFVSILFIIYFFRKKTSKSKKNFQKLSLQERKIFELIRKGATNQEISNQCLISVSTVKSHISSIYIKFNVKNRKDIVNLDL